MLDSIQNLAQKFQVIPGSDDGFFQPFTQLIFAFIPLPLGQPLVKNDAFFQFATGSPERRSNASVCCSPRLAGENR